MKKRRKSCKQISTISFCTIFVVTYLSHLACCRIVCLVISSITVAFRSLRPSSVLWPWPCGSVQNQSFVSCLLLNSRYLNTIRNIPFFLIKYWMAFLVTCCPKKKECSKKLRDWISLFLAYRSESQREPQKEMIISKPERGNFPTSCLLLSPFSTSPSMGLLLVPLTILDWLSPWNCSSCVFALLIMFIVILAFANYCDCWN